MEKALEGASQAGAQTRLVHLYDLKFTGCLSCFACLERCPRSVEPARIIEAVRVVTLREQGKNHLKPDGIPAILDDDLPQQAITSALRKYAK